MTASSKLISVCILLLFSGCVTLPKYAGFEPAAPEEHLPQFVLYPVGETLLFKTRAEVYGKTVSGLLAVKREAQGRSRLVFFKETGFTLLDLELIEKKGYLLHYAVPQMNYPVVLATIERKVRLLLDAPLTLRPEILDNGRGMRLYRFLQRKNEYLCYFVERQKDTIVSVATASLTKKNAEMTINSYITVQEHQLPSSLVITDYRVPLKIYLELMEVDGHAIG